MQSRDSRRPTMGATRPAPVAHLQLGGERRLVAGQLEAPARNLVVDDDADIRRLLTAMLRRSGYEPLGAATGADALDTLEREAEVDLVLLDLNLPGMNGYDVLRQIKQLGPHAEVPVIFVSAQGTSQDKITGLELGAVDYVTKPFDMPELLARIRGALRAKALLDRLRHGRDEFEQLSLTDPLTGLHNRRFLEDRLAQETARARRERAWLGCLMVDIDRFKSVNDRFGHSVG